MTDMEPVRLMIELLVTGFAGVLSWNFRVLKAEVRESAVSLRETDKDLQAYKLHVAEHYATSTDMKSLIEAVFKKLDRIEEKLDGKADKP